MFKGKISNLIYIYKDLNIKEGILDGYNSDISLGSNDGFVDATIPMRINKKLTSIRYSTNKKLKEIEEKFEIINNKFSLEDMINELNDRYTNIININNQNKKSISNISDLNKQINNLTMKCKNNINNQNTKNLLNM